VVGRRAGEVFDMSADGPVRPSRAVVVAGAITFVVYAATLAPDVTFWDAGEFIAAAHSLGIPHPPGTPLFVLLVNVWAGLIGRVLPYAVATNLFSAVCGASAVAASAWLIARGTRNGVAAIAGAICAGAMTTVWANATETEVYAASLALAMLTLVSAERARDESGTRWLVLTAYLIVLSVPLHLSALVAGPAAIVLSAQRDDGVDISRGLLLFGVWVLAIAAGRVSASLAVVGLILMACAAGPLARAPARSRAAGALAGTIVATALALSAVAFMLIRARHDPFVNQGNPSTVHALLEVVARRQYDVAPLWPRQAPWWLQLGNLGEYADWQVALGLGPTVLPTVPRTLMTGVFVALGLFGCVSHRAADRRTWRSLVVLGVCGSLGVATYLNMKPGPSFGWGLIPDGAPHEARERDYFFVLAFWTWGMWAGYGAVMLARRFGRRDVAGLALAALPIVLNWRAASRRGQPEAGLPRTWAGSLLAASPEGGVLLAAGDNDTYPLWYAQEVLRVRRDVRVVTMPLLVAPWYRDELVRRDHLLQLGDHAPAAFSGTIALARDVAAGANRLGRPLAASVYVDARDRDSIFGAWQTNGLVFAIQRRDTAGRTSSRSRVEVDTISALRLAAAIGAESSAPRPSLDPADEFFLRLLHCPAYVVRRQRGGSVASLDSLCNFQ
jgi:hypothetical protein